MDGLSKTFEISVDGCTECFGKGFIFTQIRADNEDDWENLGSDFFKVMILMKSNLVFNLTNSNIAMDEVENKSKVMGLIANRSKIHLFILDACPLSSPNSSKPFDDDQDTILTESTVYVKNYLLYHREFNSTDVESVLSLISVLFSRLTLHTPTRKTKQTEASRIDFSIEPLEYEHSKTRHNVTSTFATGNTNILFNRKVLKYIGESNNQSTMYSVSSNTVLKHLTSKEKYIVGVLLSHSDYSKQLPYILFNNNTYIELESLETIESDTIWDETLLCILILDIVSALRFLHKRNICHLNVNPSNVKRRGGKLTSNFLSFVLQDFEYCVHFKREVYRLFDVESQDYLKNDLPHVVSMFKAPEIDGCKYFDEKVDIYSLGVTVLQMINPRAFCDFYESVSSRTPQSKVSDWGPLVSKLTATMSLEIRALLMAMVDTIPHDRPKVSILVKVIL